MFEIKKVRGKWYRGWVIRDKSWYEMEFNSEESAKSTLKFLQSKGFKNLPDFYEWEKNNKGS